MTDEDARVAREVIIDELKTINKYEGLRDSADSEKVKDTLDDIIDEEKLHVGEASELLRRNDSRAMPALKEGASEVTKSFREVYAEKRGEVVAKAMGVHFEKYEPDRKHTNDEGEEYEDQGEYAGTSGNNDATEFPDENKTKRSSGKGAGTNKNNKNNKKNEKRVRHANRGEAKGLTDKGGKVNVKDTKGEGSSTGGNAGGQNNQKKPLTNEEIEAQYRSGELKTKPREMVGGMDHRERGIGQERSNTRSNREAAIATREKKNDFGITPEQAKKRGNDMDEALSEKKEALDQMKPAKIDLGYLEPLVVTKDPMAPLPDPDARLFEYFSLLPPALRAEAVAAYKRKMLATEANQLKGRDPSAVQQAQRILRENMGRNDMVVRDEMAENQRKASKKKASASEVPQAEGHMEKAGRKNDSEKQRQKNNDRVVRGSSTATQLKNDERRDKPRQIKTKTGAFTNPPRDSYNEAAIPSGILTFTDDPADFDMDNYNRYTDMGSSRLPIGNITGENYRTLMGGTHQIVPRRVHVRDAKGNKVYDEKRVPVLDDKHPYRLVMYRNPDGTTHTETEPNYKTDANGNIVYTTEMVPRYETRGRTVLTKRGKDLAFLQRYGGRLDVEWDPATRQWKPVGIELDKRGNIPKEMFEDLADEDGTYDPDKVFGRFRQFGYSGKDNRYEPPDMTDIIDKYYHDAAYEQLVDEYRRDIDNGKANPNVPFEDVYGENAILERAAALRAQDEAMMDEFSRKASEASRGVVDRNNMDYEKAANRAQKAFMDWLNREPYEIDDGYIIRQGENGPIRIPMEKIEAWVDANTQAAFEDSRRDFREKMSADEAAKEMAAARMQRTDKALTDSLFREMVEELGHEPSGEEESDLWNKAHAYVEKMTPDQKDAAIKDLDDAYKAQFGEPRPGSEEYIKLARQRGANSIADIQRGDFRHLWAGADPKDAYKMSFQHHKDLQAEGERQAKMRELVDTGPKAINELNSIKNEAQRRVNQDPNLLMIDKAKSLLRGKNKATISMGKDGVPYITFNVLNGSEELGRPINEIFRKYHLPKAIDPMDMEEFAKFLDSIYNHAINKEIDRTAADRGYTPEKFSALKTSASEAQSKMSRGGSLPKKATDEDIRNSLIRTLERQGAEEGPHTQYVRSRYDELSKIYNDEGHFNDVREAIYDEFLSELRGKLNTPSGQKELESAWGKDGLDKLTAIAKLPDFNTTSGTPGSLSAYDVLDDIVHWNAREGETLLPYDLARQIKTRINEATKKHNDEGIYDELLDEANEDIYGRDPDTGNPRTLREYIGSLMETSEARNNAEEWTQHQADAKPIQTTDYRKMFQDILSAPGMSRLKNTAQIYVTLLGEQGKTPEEIKDILVTALERGKGESFDMTGTNLGHQNGSSLKPEAQVRSNKKVLPEFTDHSSGNNNTQSSEESPSDGIDPKAVEQTLTQSEFNTAANTQTKPEKVQRDTSYNGSKNQDVGSIKDLKPRVEKRPKSGTEEQNKKTKADESKVEPVGKSVSFRDIYSVKRQKVLDKYHGI